MLEHEPQTVIYFIRVVILELQVVIFLCRGACVFNYNFDARIICFHKITFRSPESCQRVDVHHELRQKNSTVSPKHDIFLCCGLVQSNVIHIPRWSPERFSLVSHRHESTMEVTSWMMQLTSRVITTSNV